MTDQASYNQRGSAAHARSLGITQRATPLAAPWTGDLRVRFSDFQVNEIGKDGKVYRLHAMGLNEEQLQSSSGKGTTENSEKPKQEDTPQDEMEKKQAAPEEETVEISPEDVAELEKQGGAKFAHELVELVQSNKGADAPRPKPVTSEPLDDRSKRGEIHQAIRRIFKSKVETSTSDSGAIIASLTSSKRGQKRGRRDRRDRPRGEERPSGDYIHFSLYKDNRDTMDAVNQIARMLKVKPQTIGYAGTKDRRASTVQRCSLRYARMRSLANANGKLWGVATGDYEFQQDCIHLGQLAGNEFTITIKNCEMTGGPSGLTAPERLAAMKPQVQSAFDHMAEHGWINYFGHQRFGTHEIGTHEIGKLLLSDKCEEAVDSLLSYDADIAERAENGEEPHEPSQRDESLRHQACMLFKTDKDVEKAMKIMPRRFSAEVAIMRHLTKGGRQSRRDFVGAIVFITRGLRTMYLHAYQSFVWNHVASKRWELHGDKVIKGDLVIAESETAAPASTQDQDGDEVINPLDDDGEAPVRARPVTDEEVASGRFTVYDVVLPSPGYDVVYPDNEIGAFYAEFMGREENGALDPHSMRRMRREFSLPGRYRKLMNRFLAPPSIEFRLYADDREQMHPTDLDRIKAGWRNASAKKHARTEDDEPAAKRAKVEESEAPEEGAGEKQPAQNGDAPAEAEEPTKIAAIVRFQLGSSAYATVALRELMGDPPE